MKFFMLTHFHKRVDWHLNLSSDDSVSTEELHSYFSLKHCPDRPVKFLLRGRKSHDVIWYSTFPFIGQKVRDLLTREGLTGWGTYPISICQDQALLETYFGLSIVGSAKGFSRRQNSGQDIFGFDENSWDGSDFFFVFGNGLLLVSQRAFDVLYKHQITGIELIPFESFGTLMDYTAILNQYKDWQKEMKKSARGKQ